MMGTAHASKRGDEIAESQITGRVIDATNGATVIVITADGQVDIDSTHTREHVIASLRTIADELAALSD